MAQTKRFTIEASMKDQTPAQSAQPDGQSVGTEDAKNPDVTLEDGELRAGGEEMIGVHGVLFTNRWVTYEGASAAPSTSLPSCHKARALGT